MLILFLAAIVHINSWDIMKMSILTVHMGLLDNLNWESTFHHDQYFILINVGMDLNSTINNNINDIINKQFIFSLWSLPFCYEFLPF